MKRFLGKNRQGCVDGIHRLHSSGGFPKALEFDDEEAKRLYLASVIELLVHAKKKEEAKSMIENYRLPQRIHPDAYMAWCRVEMRYYDLVGDKERLLNVQDGMQLVQKQFGRKDD